MSPMMSSTVVCGQWVDLNIAILHYCAEESRVNFKGKRKKADEINNNDIELN